MQSQDVELRLLVISFFEIGGTLSRAFFEIRRKISRRGKIHSICYIGDRVPCGKPFFRLLYAKARIIFRGRFTGIRLKKLLYIAVADVTCLNEVTPNGASLYEINRVFL